MYTQTILHCHRTFGSDKKLENFQTSDFHMTHLPNTETTYVVWSYEGQLDKISRSVTTNDIAKTLDRFWQAVPSTINYSFFVSIILTLKNICVLCHTCLRNNHCVALVAHRGTIGFVYTMLTRTSHPKYSQLSDPQSVAIRNTDSL